MAAVVPSADQAADLLQKLSLDAQGNNLEISEQNNKTSTDQYGSADAGNTVDGQIQSGERSVTPLLPDFVDPAMCYVPNAFASGGFYYGSYEGAANDWDDYARFANAEGVDMTSGVYGDNGSVMYHHAFGYAPYGPYSPAGTPVPGNDQLYGTQHYHYPSPYFQPLTPTSAPYTPSSAAPPQVEVPSASSDQKSLPVETVNGSSDGNANGAVMGSNVSAPAKAAQQGYNAKGRGNLPSGVASGYQDLRYGFDGIRSPIPWVDGPIFPDGQSRPVASSGMTNSFPNSNSLPSSRNQPFRPNSYYMGLQHPRPIPSVGTGNAFMNRLYTNKLYGQYGSTVRSGIAYGSTGRGWTTVDKYKNRGRAVGFYGFGNENVDGLSELSRGPRAKGSKNQKTFTPVALAVKGQSLPTTKVSEEEKDKASGVPEREQYNKADFPEEYGDAKFFVIKSYSEDDVHKSIKYKVWASTPNGNKKLDAAYREAQEKAGACPVFLLFSVNASGFFVGVAEMIGPVDFEKNVEYWQQDKWYGCFPVKWHIVKDIPNSSLKHIILENNENKPVTNSRDTQEVKLEQGLKMIKIFKAYSSKTCLLDDFDFYEGRQKSIQEKKAKQQQFQKQVWEGKSTGERKGMANGELRLQKSSEIPTGLMDITSSAQMNGELKQSDDGMTVNAGDASNVTKVGVPENKNVANGVVNGC